MKNFLAVLLLMLGMTNFCWAQANAQTGENAKMHEFMLKAVAEAEKNIISKDGGPFGAVIVKDGVIVGTGHNIKKVYYGNTAEDAADIGFRDDFIYKFIEGGCKDVQVLDLEQQQRDETIVTFKKFAEQTEKTIY